MSHPRAEIRHAVAALLTGATDCGDRVYTSRTDPRGRDALPFILVYATEEPVDKGNSSVWADQDNPGHLKRNLQLGIEIAAKGKRADDTLDAIALQVETIMDTNASIGKRVHSLMLSASTFAFYESGEDLVGVLQLIYDVSYYTKTIMVPGPDGVPVTMVLGSWAPDIGAAHVDDYVDIMDTGVPPLP